MRGIVIGRLLESDQRFIANTDDDAQTLAQMLQDDFLSCSGNVISNAELNTFTVA